MKEIDERVQPRFEMEDKGKILFELTKDWYVNNTFFTTDTIRQTRWTLKTKEVIPNSTDENYLEQTQTLVKYIEEQVFAETELPLEFEDAIEQFKQYYSKNFAGKSRAQIYTILSCNRYKYMEELSELKINQRYRENLVSFIQTTCTLLDNVNIRRLEETKTWYGILSIGDVTPEGMFINNNDPDEMTPNLGVVFCYSH